MLNYLKTWSFVWRGLTTKLLLLDTTKAFHSCLLLFKFKVMIFTVVTKTEHRWKPPEATQSHLQVPRAIFGHPKPSARGASAVALRQQAPLGAACGGSGPAWGWLWLVWGWPCLCGGARGRSWGIWGRLWFSCGMACCGGGSWLFFGDFF